MKNECSSADSLFHKGNAELYLFYFEQHLVHIYRPLGYTNREQITEYRSINVRAFKSVLRPKSLNS